MTTDGMTPLPEFLRQGLMLVHLGVGLKILQPLVHKIKGVVDQLRGLFGSHDAGSRRYYGVTRERRSDEDWNDEVFYR